MDTISKIIWKLFSPAPQKVEPIRLSPNQLAVANRALRSRGQPAEIFPKK